MQTLIQKQKICAKLSAFDIILQDNTELCNPCIELQNLIFHFKMTFPWIRLFVTFTRHKSPLKTAALSLLLRHI